MGFPGEWNTQAKQSPWKSFGHSARGPTGVESRCRSTFDPKPSSQQGVPQEEHVDKGMNTV